MEQLREKYVRLDIQRRLNLRLDPEDVELPRPRNAWEWLLVLFMSRGLLWSLNRGGRLLHAVNLAMIIAGLVGVATVAVNAQIQDRMVQLQDLEVRLQQLDDLEGQLAALEDPEKHDAPAPPATSSDTLQEVSQRLDTVDSRLREERETAPRSAQERAAEIQSVKEQFEQEARAEAGRAERVQKARSEAEGFRAANEQGSHRTHDQAQARRDRARAERGP